MTGLLVVGGVLLAVVAFGGFRRLRDGRVRAAKATSVTEFDAGAVQRELGAQATFVQFSSQICAPCRTTHRLLADIADNDPTLAHIDVNVGTHVDLVQQHHITRTPTVFILDRHGHIRHRIVGAARKTEVLDALARLAVRPAA